MSLEAALAANTEAINKLGVLIKQAMSLNLASPQAAAEQVVKTSKAALKEVEKELPNEQKELPVEQLQTTTDTSPSSEPESKPATYDDVKKLIIAISKQSKDKAVAALSRLGVANGKELKPEQWPGAVEYLTKVVGGLDPMQGIDTDDDIPF